ncbi:replication/maintenance protein RepL [uncultured Selenomonas sp.]|jgi:hypothetical protein|uniref:replication/maintenance protein RepL n=1 Tax=uncultured Selenomonas sp. TaxID=159275 RepID=UPI0028DC25C9|nr:replication/maintenance protein RepL [uncultured Selenomonas sp.]
MRLTGSLVYPFEGDAPQGGIFEHLATFASSISSVCEVSRFARMRDRDSGLTLTRDRLQTLPPSWSGGIFRIMIYIVFSRTSIVSRETISTLIDLIGNQKTRLAFWILDHLDSNNLLPMTQRQIANKSGISYQTVSRTLQSLIDSNFLQRINQGAYRVNPDVLFKGSKNARMNVLLQYRNGTKEKIIY